MRILLLTPNTTEAITDRLMGAARLVASVGTEIIPATAPRPRGRFVSVRSGF
jgi:allantoin racemase